MGNTVSVERLPSVAEEERSSDSFGSLRGGCRYLQSVVLRFVAFYGFSALSGRKRFEESGRCWRAVSLAVAENEAFDSLENGEQMRLGWLRTAERVALFCGKPCCWRSVSLNPYINTF